MAARIGSMTNKLVEVLKQAGSTHDWIHVTEQIGMFAFTGELNLIASAIKKGFNEYDFCRLILFYCCKFTEIGMSSEMSDELTSKHAIFLTRDGRISLAGLNDGNIEYVVKAIHDVTDGKKITS